MLKTLKYRKGSNWNVVDLSVTEKKIWVSVRRKKHFENKKTAFHDLCCHLNLQMQKDNMY